MAPPASAVAIIPARLGSTRFPGKVLKAETGKPLIVHVCEQAAKARTVSRVVVATDAPEVESAARAAGFEAVTTGEHPNGTSRLAEAAERLKLRADQLIVNVQGDEPEIDPGTIDSAVMAHRWLPEPDPAAPDTPPRRMSPDGSVHRGIYCATVASPFQPGEDPRNPNIVKALVGVLEADLGIGLGIYFSRSPVPYQRADGVGSQPLKHVGIYAYLRERLDRYLALPPTPLEQTEQLEQLRWIEHGLPVAVAVRTTSHTGIDTEDQYRAFVARHSARSADK